MKRFLAFLGLLLALSVQPAHAATARQKLLLLGSNNCAGQTLGLNFVSNTYCYNGSQIGGYIAIPGWTYSGGVLSGTGASGVYEVCNGVQTFFPAIAGNSTGPRVTPGCGLWIWGPATNSFLNSATGATQTVTTTAASWTLSFYGTGSVVGAGSCTINLSGTGANNRVSQTVTATAGSCVLTVTGSITNVQFEPNSFASPYMPTTSAAVSRTADIALINPFNVSTNAGTIVAKGTVGVGQAANVPLAGTGDPSLNGRLVVSYGIGNPVTARNITLTSSLNITIPIISAGSAFHGALTWTSGGRSLSVNGVTTVSDSTNPISGVGYTTQGVQLGGFQNGSSNPWNGPIQSFVLYPQTVGAAQLQVLSQ